MAISKPSIGIGVVLRRRDEVLLIQRGTPPEQGSWSLPGGKQEVGETVREAAIREISEETGLAVDIDDLVFLDVIDMIQLPHFHYTLIDFCCAKFEGTLQAGSDAQACIWAKLDELSDYHLWDETLRVIHLSSEKLDLL